MKQRKPVRISSEDPSWLKAYDFGKPIPLPLLTFIHVDPQQPPSSHDYSLHTSTYQNHHPKTRSFPWSTRPYAFRTPWHSDRRYCRLHTTSTRNKRVESRQSRKYSNPNCSGMGLYYVEGHSSWFARCHFQLLMLRLTFVRLWILSNGPLAMRRTLIPQSAR